MEQIGKRLRALREGIRLTQVQMAQILGVRCLITEKHALRLLSMAACRLSRPLTGEGECA